MDSFTISFHWRSQDRQLEIRTIADTARDFSISVYEVYRNNVYLFSMCPVITASCKQSWEILEKDREQHMPDGFVDFLGQRIDWHYRMN